MKSWMLAARQAASISAVGGVGPGVEQVGPDRVVEQVGLLRHHADLRRPGVSASRSRMSWPSMRMRPAVGS